MKTEYDIVKPYIQCPENEYKVSELLDSFENKWYSEQEIREAIDAIKGAEAAKENIKHILFGD